MANSVSSISKSTDLKHQTEDHNYDFFLDSSIPYYLIMIAYALFFLGVYLHNQFILIAFVYVVLPLADDLFSLDLTNPSKQKETVLKKNIWFKYPLYLAVLAEVFTFIYGISHLADSNYGIMYKLSCLFCLMTMQGVSINYSHELIHKVSKLDNMIGAALLVKNYYLHWFIEHNYGHHRHVATPLDPASAVKGQTVYQFIPKSFFGSLVSSWNIERKIVEDEGRSSLTNRVYLSIVIYTVYTLALFWIYGLVLGTSAIIIGISGSLYLEIVNYLEHYGLRREKLPNGEYENVTIHHSWNTPHRFTNYFLFKLQRHSDHHANALKPYQTLCSYDQSPNLPSGYALCIMLALFPSSWFNIIDPLVDVYNKTKKIPEELKVESEKKAKRFILTAGLVLSALIILQFMINYL